MADHHSSGINGYGGEEMSARTSNIEGFVATQIRKQEKSSREDDNLDKEKRDKFIARALAVSRRMNNEIEKARNKRDLLYDELGEGNMSDWRNEHSSEVLTPQQAKLVDQSYQKKL
ncbi:uncharacterized protein LOC131944406 [Physella acuta]|uniref:uncharacterized protein LOC131944406 n=1 Tax=Physella acuta TaxID=109671 RepID=UPI0027DE83A3|nr:uncharacterized protein LOC131944406 [Physella acuta]